VLSSTEKVLKNYGMPELLHSKAPTSSCAGTLQPEEVSAKILQTLIASAEEHCGSRISKAVISVRLSPARPESGIIT